MITMEPITGNVLRVTVPETLRENDFAPFTPKAEAFIRQHGKIRLLIDASHFNGWQNLTAFENHLGFVKNHQKSVERGAIIAGHAWQHWLAGVFRLFVHPQIRVFDQKDADAALEWITEGKRLSA